MRHKWLIALLLLGGGLLIILTNLQGHKSGHTTGATVSSNKGEQIDETLFRNITKNAKPLSDSISIEDLVYQEVSQSWFNDDPYLDAREAENVLSYCKYSNFEGRLIKRKNYLSVKHLVVQHKLQCEIWLEKYSTLQENLEIIEKMPATTKLGELSKQYSSESQLENFNKSMSIFELAHQDGDLETLNSVSTFMRVSSISGLERPEQSVIGGDIGYVERLAGITLDLLLCDKGLSYSCSPSSQRMMHNCLYIPETCGLTYPQWAKRFLTPGMKMDVEALKLYYTENMDD